MAYQIKRPNSIYKLPAAAIVTMAAALAPIARPAIPAAYVRGNIPEIILQAKGVYRHKESGHEAYYSDYRNKWIAARMTAERNQCIAQRIISESREYKGWNRGAQWEALQKLWTRESDWNNKAINKYSGAIGIPQLLPSAGHKIPYGYKWSPWVQIRWGLNYIKHRYGNPVRAWWHELRYNWY